MDVFEFDDYRIFLRSYIESLPKAGRGFAKKLAEDLRVSPVLVSQVLSGDRDFSVEHALGVSSVLGFSELETDYLLCLINISRAGTSELKTYYQKQREKILEKSREIRNRVLTKRELDLQAKAMYYSHWYYVAIRLIVCSEAYNTPEKISERLALPLDTVRSVLEFLESYDLVKRGNAGYEWSSTSTHIGKDSPLVNRHHQNWRIQAQRVMELQNQAQNMFFSAPMIIDRSCAERLQAKILQLIEENQKEILAAPSEDLFCLNIDLFSF